MDKLTVFIFPILKITAYIGMLCGLFFVCAGIAYYLDIIDLELISDKSERWMVAAGGAGLITVFWFKLDFIKKNTAKARERLSDKS